MKILILKRYPQMILRKQQHSVAKRKEFEIAGNRLPVKIKNFFTAGKSRDQHQQAGFGNVKIGNQSIHKLEFVAFLNEKIGLAGKFAQSDGWAAARAPLALWGL